jgi:hypothetical protein
MQVKELIEIMQRFPDQDEVLIVAWWEKDTVEEWMGRKITANEWDTAEYDVINGDWDVVDQQIIFSIENHEEEETNES